jgi:hypothetical protein
LLDDGARPLAPVVPLAGTAPHGAGHRLATSRTTGGPGGSGGPAEIVSLDAVRQHAGSAGTPGTDSVPEAPGGASGVEGGADTTRAAERGGSAEAPRAAPARPAARTYRGGSTAPGAKPADGPPLPATQTQLETIAKLARGAGRTISTEGLTRASASELITRLSEERYGARRGG